MSIEGFIRAMPKVELRVRLDGAYRKESLLAIAEQNDIPTSVKNFGQLAALLDKPDYARLDEMLAIFSGWLQQSEDLTRVVYDLGVHLSKQNVKYAEVIIDPMLHILPGLSFEDFMSAINDGRDRARRGWGIQMCWVLAMPRIEPRRADEIVRWATSAAGKRGGIVGIVLSGREDAQPPGQFERAFVSAHKKELPTAAYAGDPLGAEGVLQAINQLHPQRILDGWGTADAPDVLKLLRDEDITLDICLSRALCLNQVAAYKDYPLRHIYDDNVKLVISAEMPGVYKSTLVDEYLAVVEHCGFSLEELEELALNAISASFLPDEDKLAMAAEFRQAYAVLRDEHISPAAT